MRSKISRIIILIMVDAAIVAFSSIMPLALRFGIFTMDISYLEPAIRCLPIDILITIAVLAVFKLYNRVWTYAGIDDMLSVFKASLVIEALYVVYRILAQVAMPRSFYIFNWVFLFILLAGSRASIRILRQFKKRYEKTGDFRNVMIIGAGSAASILIKELQYGLGDSKVVCIIDDNPAKKGKYIHSIPIVGSRSDIPYMAKKYRIDEIIIAIPSAQPTTIRSILNICQETDCRLKRLPSISSSLTSSLSQTVREVNYEDLLGRDAIVMENAELTSFVSGKTIMVTGGGGTIGSELCRQIVANKPGKLLVVDIYENGAYELQMELLRYYPEAEVEVLIASVRDYDRMEGLFKEYRPDVIYHAAAHKHVPLMEYSPNEAVKNNCKGTLNMVKLADKYSVKKFVLISTDKAVRPTNVMGATKRICEMIVQTYSRMSETEFVAVRFGNVLGSNGSVIPLFLKQIEAGGPVTLTHREITRFFMTVSEAVSLVLKAGLMAKGGEIFVLDMGQPVKIYDLAVNLIKMKGYVPEKDIKIEIVGLRPGEKLYEELLMDEEGLQSTTNDLIFIGQPINIDDKKFMKQLDNLIIEATKNGNNIKNEIKKVCDTYRPQQEKENMINKKRIFLASPHMSDAGYEMEYIKEAFDTNWIAPLGANVNNFEKEMCEVIGCKSSLALVSGTAAMHMAIKLLEIGENDIVFCQSLTFSATVNPVVYEGAKPVFIDSDLETWNMSPEALKKAFDKYSRLGKLPKAVIVVHLYGLAADMDEIAEICSKYNVPIIEDAAESLGSSYKGKMTGSFGKYSIVSFNGNKIITSSGGGMLLCNGEHAEEDSKKALFWSTQAREPEKYYQHKELGYNYRMSNIVAGIGRGQLKVLEDRVNKKREIYKYYAEAFENITDIYMMPLHDDIERSNCWLSCLVLDEKSSVTPVEIMNALEADNIEARHIWKPMHMQPFFCECDYIDNGGAAEKLFEQGVCLPSDTKMDEADLKRVTDIVKNLWKK